jgi:hypothetical protein
VVNNNFTHQKQFNSKTKIMKPIKFDLPLNGTRISTLEQLAENLTPEILEPFRSGKLAKWLRVRKLDEQSGAIEALLAADIQDEVQLFIKLCEVFEREVDEDDAREMIETYKDSLTSSNDDVYVGVFGGGTFTDYRNTAAKNERITILYKEYIAARYEDMCKERTATDMCKELLNPYRWFD